MGVIIAAILICFCTVFAFGQNKVKDLPAGDLGEKRPATMSLLSSYYGQDGEHGAVNGGIGSQLLNSYSQEASIYIPIKDSSAFKVHGGVDYFTSASLKMIDKYITNASAAKGDVSKDERRTYANIGMDLADKRHNSIHTPNIGFSTEYDVNSFNIGYSWTKYMPERNMSYQLGLSLVVDRWLLIYPGEFRTQVMGGKYVGSTNNTGTWTSGTTTTGSGSTSGSGSTTGASTGTGSGSGGISTGSGSTGGNSGGNKITSGSSTGASTTTESSSAGGNSATGGTTGSGSTTGASTDTSGSGNVYTTGASADSSSWVAVPVGYAKPIEATGNTVTKNGKTYPVDWRYSWAVTNTVTFVINQRMNGAAGLDIMGQSGLLSTPFYRVYFNDNVKDELDKQVAVEKLPRKRLKAAIYGRYNYQVIDRVAVRTSLRYYMDTWNVQAVTATAEVPVKVTGWLTVNLFYRLHVQQSSRYFKPYGQHVMGQDEYYTNDYDLSGFTAHKVGAAVRFSPLRPLFSLYNSSAASIFSMPSIGVRYMHYMRSDGLAANSVSLEMNFNL